MNIYEVFFVSGVIMNINMTNLYLKNNYTVIGPNHIFNSDEAFNFVKEQIGNGTVERFFLICMDYDYMPINCSVIGIGNNDKIIVDIGEVFKIALLSNAYHIIVAHNHLGSSLVPTESDLQTTKQIGYVGNILGIPLIDSIIVNSSDEYMSIRKFVMQKEKSNGLE